MSDTHFPMHVQWENTHVKTSKSKFPWIYWLRQYCESYTVGDDNAHQYIKDQSSFIVFFSSEETHIFAR